MDKIIEIITKAMSENLEAVVLLIVVTGILYLLNILFGTILGTNEVGFNLKKFFFGFLKGLYACIGIFAFCYVLNLFSLTLALVDINISVEVITVLEVVSVMVTWDINLATEIYEKIKSLINLKYVTYDDITVNDYSVDERG